MSNFPNLIIMGHRGIPTLALENTIESFEAIKVHNIAGVEFDIRCCKCGTLVVFHDKTLERLAGSTSKISDLRYDEIKNIKLSNGTFSGTIPKLSDVLDLLGPDCWIDIEVKSETIKDDLLEEQLIRLLDSYSHHKTIVSSFNPFRVKKLKKTNPELTVGLIYSSEEPFWLRLLGGIAGKADFYKPNFKDLKNTRSKPQICWTVDQQAEADRMFALGASAIISNNPHVLKVN